MRVSHFTTVGAKLFYYMSGLVLLTVVGNSIQFRKAFLKSQTKQLHESVQIQAERTSGQIESTIESWRSQLAVALPTLRTDAKKSQVDAIQRFVDSSPDYVSLQLISAPAKNSTKFVIFAQAFTSRHSDPRFEEKSSERVKSTLIPHAISWLQKKVSGSDKTNFFLENAGPTTGLPIATVAVRFDVAGDKTVVWAILSVWQSNVVKSLAKSKFIKTVVIDKGAKIFSSPIQDELIKKSDLSKTNLFYEATNSSSPSGFINEFRDTNQNRRIGAFSKIPRYGLNVLVDQDVEFAYQNLNENLLNTALWAALFILISMMFSFIGATGITKGLRTVAEATSKIASGNFNSRITLNSRDEVGLLGEAVNNMSGKIVELMDSQIKKAQFEKELETAKVVQSTFFPKTDRSKKDLTVSGFYTPASECGGDLWGHFTIDTGLEFVFIADAMGHGAPAALVTAMAYSATMTVAEYVRENPSLRDSPSKVLTRLNRIIWEAVRGSISMTFFASIIDLNKGIITYANAGHNFPVVLPMDPNDPRARNLKPVSKHSNFVPISLKLMGTPLGMAYESSYKDQTIQIMPGDKLFYFTDGLIECESSDGIALGRKWLLESICSLGRADAHQMKNAILESAFGFFGSNPIKDDITVVVLELAKDWVPNVSHGENVGSLLPLIGQENIQQRKPSTSGSSSASISSNSPTSRPIPETKSISVQTRALIEEGIAEINDEKSTTLVGIRDFKVQRPNRQKIRLKSPFSA